MTLKVAKTYLKVDVHPLRSLYTWEKRSRCPLNRPDGP